ILEVLVQLVTLSSSNTVFPYPFPDPFLAGQCSNQDEGEMPDTCPEQASSTTPSASFPPEFDSFTSNPNIADSAYRQEAAVNNAYPPQSSTDGKQNERVPQSNPSIARRVCPTKHFVSCI